MFFTESYTINLSIVPFDEHFHYIDNEFTSIA